jgi:hypothetical protein
MQTIDKQVFAVLSGGEFRIRTYGILVKERLLA